MVNIDTVYQRILAIANKEQRGYITPLEFNLLANQAQMDVFEQYFYDKNQNERLPGNETDYSDVADILDEKISVFEKSGVVANGITLPIDLYRLGIITTPELYEAERVDRKDFFTIMASPLTRPTNNRPIYTRDESGVKVYNSSGQILTNLSCTYVKQPSKVEWGYVVTTSGGSTTNGKALYNPSTSTNFEHHRSDETELVLKILELAGIVINKPQLSQYALTKVVGEKTEQNS